MPNDYFGYFPTVPYETFDGSGKYKVVTDIFKRVRASLQAREDQTVSYEYEVKDKETAEIVSYKYYGYAQYHWVIFLMNSIRDPQWQFPLSGDSFEKFIAKKYGTLNNAFNETSHYETRKLVAPVSGYGYKKGEVLIPKGLQVSSDFSFSYAAKTFTSAESTERISAYQNESNINENNRKIVLLKKNLVPEFIVEFDSLINPRNDNARTRI